jgi:hypothetical protein
MKIFRKAKWAYQRVTRGYSDLDAWNLNSFVAKVVADVAKGMRENGYGYPADLTEDEWGQILGKIEDGFRAATDLYEMNYNDRDDADKLEATFRDGMELFSKWFHSLWD